MNCHTALACGKKRVIDVWGFSPIFYKVWAKARCGVEFCCRSRPPAKAGGNSTGEWYGITYSSVWSGITNAAQLVRRQPYQGNIPAKRNLASLSSSALAASVAIPL